MLIRNILNGEGFFGALREGEGGGSPAPTPAPTPAPAGDPWYKGADSELVGHIQNKGWDKKPINEAAIEAVRAQREAERLIGVPADQIVRLPKDLTDAEAMKPVYQRLGAPVDGKYDFSDIKFADGTELDPDFVKTMSTAAAAKGLSKDAAHEITKSVVKFMEGAETATTAEQTAKIAEEKATLEKNWGVNKEANLFIARNAVKNLGIDPAAVAALEGQIGYSKVMEMFHLIGVKTGEAKFFQSDPQGNGGNVMTKDQAVARIGELKGDREWSAAYLKGDAAKVREMKALQILATGETPAW